MSPTRHVDSAHIWADRRDVMGEYGLTIQFGSAFIAVFVFLSLAADHFVWENRALEHREAERRKELKRRREEDPIETVQPQDDSELEAF